MRYNKIFLIALISSTSLTTIASATSFDCAKAGQPVEILICDSDKLKKLDDDLSRNYADLKHRLTGEKLNQLISDQRLWAKKRNSTCVKEKDILKSDALRASAKSCLELQYISRIMEIISAISDKILDSSNNNSISSKK